MDPSTLPAEFTVVERLGAHSLFDVQAPAPLESRTAANKKEWSSKLDTSMFLCVARDNSPSKSEMNRPQYDERALFDQVSQGSVKHPAFTPRDELAMVTTANAVTPTTTAETRWKLQVRGIVPEPQTPVQHEQKQLELLQKGMRPVADDSFFNAHEKYRLQELEELKQFARKSTQSGLGCPDCTKHAREIQSLNKRLDVMRKELAAYGQMFPLSDSNRNFANPESKELPDQVSAARAGAVGRQTMWLQSLIKSAFANSTTHEDGTVTLAQSDAQKLMENVDFFEYPTVKPEFKVIRPPTLTQPRPQAPPTNEIHYIIARNSEVLRQELEELQVKCAELNQTASFINVKDLAMQQEALEMIQANAERLALQYVEQEEIIGTAKAKKDELETETAKIFKEMDKLQKKSEEAAKTHPELTRQIEALSAIVNLYKGVKTEIKTPFVAMDVTVKVKSAKNLMAADANGFSDPFVQVKMGKTKVKTKVQKKTLNPTWNEDFKFTISSRQEEIEFNVFDWDRFGSNDEIGNCRISGGEIKVGVNPMELALKDADSGVLVLSIVASPASVPQTTE
eukprot:GFYU01028695.1.p1 GENE.GFYU01028695.1~~GFYU01028695.1.p1  ORF type:complete len:567 (+),score=139.85 GFYU01028695.1:250-1950(+)